MSSCFSSVVVGQQFEFVRNIVGFVFISNTVGWQWFEVLDFYSFNLVSSIVFQALSSDKDLSLFGIFLHCSDFVFISNVVVWRLFEFLDFFIVFCPHAFQALS